MTLIDEDDAEAFQCPKCTRMFHAENYSAIESHGNFCAGELQPIPIERFEDHLHNLNTGDL
jgi:hypothetical protein